MNEQNYKSNAAFLCWMKPVLVALKELGEQGTPQDVRSIIAKNEHLTEKEPNFIKIEDKINFSNKLTHFFKNKR